MAAFPAGIKWSVSSSFDENLGIQAEEMSDGKAHVQTQISSTSEIVNWNVANEPLDQSERNTVMSFLRTNYADIQLVDPVSLLTYSGKMVSEGVGVRLLSATTWRLTWRFTGEKV